MMTVTRLYLIKQSVNQSNRQSMVKAEIYKKT